MQIPDQGHCDINVLVKHMYRQCGLNSSQNNLQQQQADATHSQNQISCSEAIVLCVCLQHGSMNSQHCCYCLPGQSHALQIRPTWGYMCLLGDRNHGTAHKLYRQFEQRWPTLVQSRASCPACTAASVRRSLPAHRIFPYRARSRPGQAVMTPGLPSICTPWKQV